MRETYSAPQEDVRHAFNIKGLTITSFNIFFNHPIIKNSFGIQSISYYFESDRSYVRFHLNDSKKFFIKALKYGI